MFKRIFISLCVLIILLGLVSPAIADNPLPDVLAWGYNAEGQTNVPADFANDNAIAAGYYHNLALKVDGTVWTWGGNDSGQLGNGGSDLGAHPDPAPVGGLDKVTAIAAGAYHSLVIRDDGKVWVWGRNAQGQLGDGSTSDSFLPKQVAGLGPNGNGFTRAIAGGYGHSLAALTDGSVWAWGLNNMGQLGLSIGGASLGASSVQNIADAPSPRFVLDPPPALSLPSDFKVGSYPGMVLGPNAGGTVPYYNPTPIQVPVVNNVVAVAAGYDHSVALINDGTVWTWGDNSIGQLGLGTADGDPHPVPALVPRLFNVVAIAAGVGHSLALKSDGTVWAWGRNVDGELGDGTTTDASRPVQVTVLSGPVRAIAAGGYHSLAVFRDGTLAAWGLDTQGQIDLPQNVNNGSRVSAGLMHSLTVLANRPPWDINGDHVVNVLDITRLGAHFGETGPAGWIPEDVNSDGGINVLDVSAIGLNWGRTW